MLSFKGKAVRFRLSPEGKRVLEGLFSRSSFQAKVHEVDELGAWIVLDQPNPDAAKTVMLLKWDYFSTAVLEAEREESPGEKQDIGFKARNIEEP
jgi:hypothetical protein